MRQTLEAEHYQVVLATDGQDAIEKAREFRPDLAILDIEMPGVDGYSVCSELKTMGPPWNRVPIVFLTMLHSRALELLGEEMGAYLRKPFQAPLLLDVVQKFIRPVTTSD